MNVRVKQPKYLLSFVLCMKIILSYFLHEQETCQLVHHKQQLCLEMKTDMRASRQKYSLETYV